MTISYSYILLIAKTINASDEMYFSQFRHFHVQIDVIIFTHLVKYINYITRI